MYLAKQKGTKVSAYTTLETRTIICLFSLHGFRNLFSLFYPIIPPEIPFSIYFAFYAATIYKNYQAY